MIQILREAVRCYDTSFEQPSLQDVGTTSTVSWVADDSLPYHTAKRERRPSANYFSDSVNELSTITQKFWAKFR